MPFLTKSKKFRESCWTTGEIEFSLQNMSTKTDASEERYSVPALERGLRILELFGETSPRLSLSDIARKMELGRSTIFRLVYTLEQAGFLNKVDDRFYQLGSRVLALGFRFIAEQDIIDLARPILQRLRDKTNASSHLGIREGRDVIYLLREPSRDMLISNIGVGSRLPAHQTTVGRVLLSSLGPDEIKQLYRKFTFPPNSIGSVTKLIEQLKTDHARGYVADESAYGPGLVSVAAEVFDATGAVVAGITISAPAVVLPLSVARQSAVKEVVAAARELSDLLGFKRRLTG